MSDYEELRKNDPQVFATWFYETYKRFVYNQAWKYCGQIMDADDLTQEVWVNLLGKSALLRTYTKEQQLSYIAVAVRNTAISFARRTKDEYPLEVASGVSCNEQLLLDEFFCRQQKVEAFRMVWPLVPPQTREILERKYVLFESDAEIARAIGIKPSSVRMYLTRARKVALSILLEQKDKIL